MANIILKNVTKCSKRFKEASPTLAFLISLGILLMLAFVIVWPFITIWSINVMFNTTIAYTFKTWLASYLLLLSLNSAVRVSNK